MAARLANVIQLAREAAPELLIFYHSDGDFTRLIPDLVEIGVNVINPVQPDCMDAIAIKREFGDRLALWGTVGSANTWDFGSPEQIRSEVRHRIATLGPAGLLLAPAYDIDFTPLENIAAFVEAVREFGQSCNLNSCSGETRSFVGLMSPQNPGFQQNMSLAPTCSRQPDTTGCRLPGCSSRRRPE